MMHSRIFRAGLTAAAILAAGTAQAVTVYTDETAFVTATGANDVALPNLGSVGSSTTVGDLTLSLNGGGASDLFVGTSGFEATFGPQFSTLIDGNDIGISGPENFAIDFGLRATAFGMFVHEPTDPGPATPTTPDVCNTGRCVDSEFTISLFRDGTSIGSFILNPVDDSADFIGFADSMGFDRIEITETVGTDDNEFFGGFKLAVAPLPASLPLLLAGLFGLGALARRRR
jgi:hypothetical protein